MKPDKSLQIFGSVYKYADLLKLCSLKISSPDIPDWEKEIYTFINSWFSNSTSIKVKTSGSTGTPKEMYLQKKHMVVSAAATLKYFELQNGDTIWLCLPMKYIAAKMMIVRAITGRLNLVYSQPSTKINLPANNIKFTAMVQNQVVALLETKVGIEILKNSGKLLIGGSGISSSVEKNTTKHDIQAWHSYGMTETITHIALRKLGTDKSFHLLPGVSIETNDNDQLIIDAPERGVSKMLTNDLCKILDDGSFIIIGRSDNIIITGGIKVSPEVVEDKLAGSIAGDFFIGSIPDKLLGQKIICFIEENDNKNSKQYLFSIANNKLSKYERPKEFIFLKKLLRTETHKIKRKDNIQAYLKSTIQ